MRIRTQNEAHDAPLFFVASLCLLFSLCIPLSCGAAVSVSEIMYDPPGTDDGHEWIEVYNSGAPIDLSKWKLFEGSSNHGISAYAGGSNLATGAYAVLADNPQKFLADWPSFSGLLFDTAFSGGLNNTNGEALILRDDSLVDRDSVTYSPSAGANGDGNSLQKTGSSFVAAVPTPGKALGGSVPTDTADTEDDTADAEDVPEAASSTPHAGAMSYPVEPQIRVSAGSDRTVVAGADTVFAGKVEGLKGDAIANARVVWNFGNGESREGHSVLYAFPYPGRYAVVVDASSDTYGATTRFTVTVVPAEIAITEVNDEFIGITNRSELELNLGLWELSADGKLFRFPMNTILFPHESVSVSNRATGLAPSSPQAVLLLYPNGTLAAAYGTELIMARQRMSATGTSAPRTVSSVSARALPDTQVSEAPSGKLLAAPITAFASSSVPLLASFAMLPWILGLLAIIGIGIAAALLIKSEKGTTTGYTIIEEES